MTVDFSAAAATDRCDPVSNMSSLAWDLSRGNSDGDVSIAL